MKSNMELGIAKLTGKPGKMNHKDLIKYEQYIFKELVASGVGCGRCGRTTNSTLDHIIPMQILLSFGVDTKREPIEGNYQILCVACNHMKSNRLDFAQPKTKELLLRLLERV